MSAHGFRSLYMAAGVAGAALGCYLVSLNVASERSKLEAVEAEIVATERAIRVLQTEIGTRGRLAQLERWNVNFVRLSAPTADQFLEGGFQLATMVKPTPKTAIEAPVVLAAAPAGERTRGPTDDKAEANVATPAPRPNPGASDMMRVAGYPSAKAEDVAKPKPKPAAPKPQPARPKPAADPLAPAPRDDSAGQ